MSQQTATGKFTNWMKFLPSKDKLIMWWELIRKYFPIVYFEYLFRFYSFYIILLDIFSRPNLYNDMLEFLVKYTINSRGP